MLNSQRIVPWHGRADACQYVMQVDDLVTDVEELREAARASMRIGVYSGTATESVVSLKFLEPVIEEVRHLSVNCERVTDVDVLGDAVSLRSLELEVRTIDGSVDFSRLPEFEEFSGAVNRSVATVMKSPTLRSLRIEGAIGKSFANVSGPVERYEQYGARSQESLPTFAHPEAMRSLQRIGAARFDLAQVAGMTALRTIGVSSCGDVVGLSVLSELPDLESIAFSRVSTQERWEDLPPVEDGFMFLVSPTPSRAFIEERRAVGWVLPQPLEEAAEAIRVDESADGESWGVYISRFDDLEDAVEIVDGSVADGMRGEAFLLGVVADLRRSGELLHPDPDSESEFTVVYFPDESQARRVYDRARELLRADTATKVAVLRTGE